MSGGPDFDPKMDPATAAELLRRRAQDSPVPIRPTLEVEAHHLLEAPDSAALAHELSADCWCGPDVQIVHRLAAPAPAPSTIPDHQVVSLDELRKRGDL